MKERRVEFLWKRVLVEPGAKDQHISFYARDNYNNKFWRERLLSGEFIVNGVYISVPKDKEHLLRDTIVSYTIGDRPVMSFVGSMVKDGWISITEGDNYRLMVPTRQNHAIQLTWNKDQNGIQETCEFLLGLRCLATFDVQ
jgi:hypothetical protein